MCLLRRRLRRYPVGHGALPVLARQQGPSPGLRACLPSCRHLHIPLVQAERAWAYAMDLKGQLEEQMEAQVPAGLVCPPCVQRPLPLLWRGSCCAVMLAGGT